MNTTRRLWIGLGLLLAVAFAILLAMGRELYLKAPPMPERVVSASGQALYTRGDIELGRRVWQSIGGQQLGSIWGHGALVAPDWSADWLHREALALVEIWSQRDYGSAYARLAATQREVLNVRLREELRRNQYRSEDGTLLVSADRAQAIATVAAHYESVFGTDPATAALRVAYAMREGTVDTAEHRQAMTGFFFWTSWAAVTNRPRDTKSYTSNWPYDPLVGNTPVASTFLWTVFSVLFMIAGIALLAWHYAAYHRKELPVTPPATDPLAALVLTPRCARPKNISGSCLRFFSPRSCWGRLPHTTRWSAISTDSQSRNFCLTH